MVITNKKIYNRYTETKKKKEPKHTTKEIETTNSRNKEEMNRELPKKKKKQNPGK